MEKTYILETIETRTYRVQYEVEAESEDDVCNKEFYEMNLIKEELLDIETDISDLYLKDEDSYE